MQKCKCRGVESYVILLARNFSLKLVNSGLFLFSDFDDLKQEFIYHYLRKKDKYDPTKSSPETFVYILFQSKSKDMTRKVLNVRSKYSYSLDESAFRDNSYNGSFSEESISHKDLIESHYDSDFNMEISTDIQKVFNRLPNDLKRVCRLLQSHSIKEIAANLNISQRRVYYLIDKLKKYFKEAGMDKYL